MSSSSRWKRFAFFDRSALPLPSDVLEEVFFPAPSSASVSAAADANKQPSSGGGGLLSCCSAPSRRTGSTPREAPATPKEEPVLDEPPAERTIKILCPEDASPGTMWKPGVKIGDDLSVEQVREDSAAEDAGVTKGEFIVRIDGVEVATRAEATKALVAATKTGNRSIPIMMRTKICRDKTWKRKAP